MKFKRYTGITWSTVELSGLLEDPDSLVSFQRTRKHFGLHPFHLTDLQTSVNEILSSKLNSYDRELKGFVLAYKNPRLIGPLGEILYDSCFIHVDIEVDLYVFRPEVGCSVKGLVNKKGLDHIGVLVHKAFNVLIPRNSKAEEEEGWPGDNVSIGQEVRFIITQIDPSSRLPFIRAALSKRDYLSGCKLGVNGEYKCQNCEAECQNRIENQPETREFASQKAAETCRKAMRNSKDSRTMGKLWLVDKAETAWQEEEEEEEECETECEINRTVRDEGRSGKGRGEDFGRSIGRKSTTKPVDDGKQGDAGERTGLDTENYAEERRGQGRKGGQTVVERTRSTEARKARVKLETRGESIVTGAKSWRAEDEKPVRIKKERTRTESEGSSIEYKLADERTIDWLGSRGKSGGSKIATASVHSDQLGSMKVEVADSERGKEDEFGKRESAFKNIKVERSSSVSGDSQEEEEKSEKKKLKKKHREIVSARMIIRKSCTISDSEERKQVRGKGELVLDGKTSKCFEKEHQEEGEEAQRKKKKKKKKRKDGTEAEAEAKAGADPMVRVKVESEENWWYDDLVKREPEEDRFTRQVGQEEVLGGQECGVSTGTVKEAGACDGLSSVKLKKKKKISEVEMEGDQSAVESSERLKGEACRADGKLSDPKVKVKVEEI